MHDRSPDWSTSYYRATSIRYARISTIFEWFQKITQVRNEALRGRFKRSRRIDESGEGCENEGVSKTLKVQKRGGEVIVGGLWIAQDYVLRAVQFLRFRGLDKCSNRKNDARTFNFSQRSRGKKQQVSLNNAPYIRPLDDDDDDGDESCIGQPGKRRKTQR